MILLDNVLLSDEVLEEAFVCDLHSCKGACCVGGDLGAPLQEEELSILNKIYPRVKKYLTKEGRKTIEEKGLYTQDPSGKAATPLIDKTGPCVYYFRDKAGIVKCGIEQAFIDEQIDFKKPISCHLYPIRVKEDESLSILNYDRWDLCKAACVLGKKLKIPVYKFLKEPLERKFGVEFYERLEEAVEYRQGIDESD